MMHIPIIGNRMIDHNVKDFRSVIDIDLDWASPGTNVPDILGG